MFESPYLASILGLLYGIVLIGAYTFTALKFVGERAKMGLYISFALSGIQLVLTLGILLLYREFAKAGVIYFGVSMAIGFAIGFIYLVVKLMRKQGNVGFREKDRG